MILVANFVENEMLIELLSAKLAVLIANMNVPQVREFFNIQSGFASKEEEDKIDEENDEAIQIYDLDRDE